MVGKRHRATSMETRQTRTWQEEPQQSQPGELSMGTEAIQGEIPSRTTRSSASNDEGNSDSEEARLQHEINTLKHANRILELRQEKARMQRVNAALNAEPNEPPSPPEPEPSNRSYHLKSSD